MIRRFAFGLFLMLVFVWASTSVFAQVLYTGKADPNARTNVPSDSIGADHSWYLDLLTGNVYGPKESGQWPPTPVPIGLAKSGANSDITSLNGLTTPLTSRSGGTGLDSGATLSQFTGTITTGGTYGTSLTVSDLNGSALFAGELISGSGVAAGTTIYGTPNADGSWPVSPDQTVGPIAMTANYTGAAAGCPNGTLAYGAFSASATHINCGSILVPQLSVNKGTLGQLGAAAAQNGYYIRNRINIPIYGGMYALNSYTELATTSLTPNGFAWYDGAALGAISKVNDRGLSTTSTAIANTSDASVTVAATTVVSGGNTNSMLVGDVLLMALDNGYIFSTVITGIAGNVVSISPSFPSPMASGAAVYDAKSHIDGVTAFGGLQGTATDFYSVDAVQATASLQAGTSSALKFAILANNDQNDRVRGSLYDGLIGLSAVSGGSVPQFKNGFVLGPMSGKQPIGSDGNLMTAYNSNVINSFFELSNWTCSGGYELHFSNSSLDCLGNMSVVKMSHSGSEYDLTLTKAVPTTGGTVTISQTTESEVIDPAGTLASLTIVTPSCAPGTTFGKVTKFMTTQAVTTLTLSAAGGTGTFAGAVPTTLAAGDAYSMKCYAATGVMYMAKGGW